MAVRRFPVRTIAIVLVLALIAAVIAALVTPGGDDGAGAQQLVRAEPVTEPFEGLGVWVDIYDEPAWAAPADAVADMADHGVRTLYLQTSNADRPGSVRVPGGWRRSWTRRTTRGSPSWRGTCRISPTWCETGRGCGTRCRSRRLEGDTFDGFALDIESDAVADPDRRTQRLVRLSTEIREEAGEDYPLGAVIPSPIRLRDDLAYWPGFPWRDLALTFDAIMPMTYYTFRAHGPAASFDYVADSIDEIRARVGTDQVPIHVIGGLARDAAVPETLAFARAVDDRAVLGGSWYTWSYANPEQWSALRRIG